MTRTRRRRHPASLRPPSPAAGNPVSRAWLALVDTAAAPATRTVARRRLRGGPPRRVVVAPGSVRVDVRQTTYRSQVVELRVPEVDDAAWDGLLGVTTQHGRWVADLAVGHMPDALAAALVGAGLVPDAFDAQCTCRSESAGLCVHATMAAFLAGDLLAGDPAAMLTLRAMLPERVRERLIARLPGGHAAAASTRDPAGIDWNSLVSREQPSLPAPPPAPRDASRRGPIPPPPPAAGLDATDLDALAADAAERAAALLAGKGDGALELDVDADLGRRVAALDEAALGVLAARSGMAEEELAALGAAWRIGGAAAVAALRRLWRPPPRALEPGIGALGPSGDVTWRMNRVIAADGQTELALGRDGLWYLLRRRGRGAALVLARPGESDPGTLLARPALPSGPEKPPEQLSLL